MLYLFLGFITGTIIKNNYNPTLIKDFIYDDSNFEAFKDISILCY